MKIVIAIFAIMTTTSLAMEEDVPSRNAMLLADTTEPAAETMRGAFDALHRIQALSKGTAERMMKAVGFRNTAVHAYQQIDWAIVHKITHEHLADFSTFVREIDRYIEKESGTDGPPSARS